MPTILASYRKAMGPAPVGQADLGQVGLGLVVPDLALLDRGGSSTNTRLESTVQPGAACAGLTALPDAAAVLK